MHKPRPVMRPRNRRFFLQLRRSFQLPFQLKKGGGLWLAERGTR